MRPLGAALVLASVALCGCLSAGSEGGSDDANAEVGADTSEEDTAPPEIGPPDVTTPDIASPDATTPDDGDAVEPDTPERPECPVARFTIAEGEVVTPGTTLHLDGSQSLGIGAPIVGYEWHVERPAGSQDHFAPSPSVAMPSFTPSVLGSYRISLSVTDQNDVRSCQRATRTVHVVHEAKIRVELVWSNPNDPDLGDDRGPDLDLHFAHPLARGGFDGDGDGHIDPWFDTPFDCFWHNPAPNWGDVASAADNPHLIENASGGYREVLVLAVPEHATYKVGVHLWDTHGFGPTFATLRVFFDAELIFSVEDVRLEDHDLWYVTDVTWPPGANPPEPHRICAGTHTPCRSDGDCTSSECVLRITPFYRHPEFFQP
jgi:hypothetical protein